MKFYKNLYLGKTAGERKRRLISNIKRHKSDFGVYVIALAAGENNLLDIMPVWMIPEIKYSSLEKNSKDGICKTGEEETEILGLACGREESFEVCRVIIMDVYNKTGGFDVRGYFS